ncbi:response regulator transcription factor [Phyllobacterium sp. SB3]|uniref:response regulator transcription factor n=1 Tax=Phyllobacterium sp. SB3 TaxID=3156073 RepID=UPI0032B0225E
MTQKTPVKVLLVDNHPLVADGLRAILQTYDHIQIVGSAGSASAAIEIARDTGPDIVLLDINMPNVSGIEAIEMFRKEGLGCRIIMLSMHDSREYISSSVMRGASGYVLKDVPTDEIAKAIAVVADGGTFFSTGVPDVLLERHIKYDAIPLTTREKSILVQIASGKSNRDIAAQLGISNATVETHRKNLKRKLHIPTTAGLVRYALDNGLGEMDL